ncbi:MAG: D-alanine--D-alanine ligase [Oscillospiraceae bacterium]|nr:D-alanine--D-alanine ligase [Oscillospiraceae bacterium]MBQ8978656.1 D-alanine--D-alanine ligase [Oscillospiraceae bacterium]
MAKTKVAVIFGGRSNEHDISLISASNVIRNIDRTKYEVIPIGITKKGRWYFYPGDVDGIQSGEWETNTDNVPAAILPDPLYRGIATVNGDEINIIKVDVVFPVLHGKYGEDGTIQGLLDMAGIPYVGCGCFASAACMDKNFTHKVLEYHGIRMAKSHAIRASELDHLDEFCELAEKDLGYPIFVKPCSSGSSVGVNKANNTEELKNAIKLAFTHDRKVIVEECIKGRELEVAVLGGAKPFASEPGEIISCNDFYDYDAKYVLGATSLKIPADIPPEVSSKIRETAILAFRAIGCFGLSRVDFFLSDKGEVILNEINTMPGFTNISMYPMLMDNFGIPYSELLDKLITLAFERTPK